MTGPARTLEDAVADVTAGLGGTVGVAARDLASGAGLYLAADEPYPLASVFKVPVMVEVLRRVDAGDVRLEERLTLREDDKSPGGPLIHCGAGLAPTVRDLLYLMITLSDNTAADMLWRRVGLDSIDRTMHALGLASISCTMPDREYFLLETGLGSDWEGLNGEATVSRWRELEARDGRDAVLARLRDDNARLDGPAFQHRWDERRGRHDDRDLENAAIVDQALDNSGSPRDVLELLAMIAEARCASAPSCRLMVEIMSRQEWRDRIPAGLPDGVVVANKTGSVAGTCNDAAIICGRGQVPLVLVVFCKGLDPEQTRRAPAAIAAIAGLVHERLGGDARRAPGRARDDGVATRPGLYGFCGDGGET